MSKELKALEGKVVYLLPTGNNVRGGRVGDIREGKILKVAKVNCTFSVNGVEYTHRMDQLHLDGGWNGGYDVFASLQEVEDLEEVKKIASSIYQKYSYPGHYHSLDLATIQAVAKLLGVTDEEV